MLDYIDTNIQHFAKQTTNVASNAVKRYIPIQDNIPVEPIQATEIVISQPTASSIPSKAIAYTKLAMVPFMKRNRMVQVSAIVALIALGAFWYKGAYIKSRMEDSFAGVHTVKQWIGSSIQYLQSFFHSTPPSKDEQEECIDCLNERIEELELEMKEMKRRMDAVVPCLVVHDDQVHLEAATCA